MQTTDIDNREKHTAETRPNGIKKILLIGKKQQIGLSAALRGEGYDVIHCDSVQQAWGFFYRHRPNLIVIQLDHFDSDDLRDLQECHTLAERVPIILTTCAQVDETLRKALQHRTAAIVDLSSTAQGFKEALHSLDISR